MRRPPCSLSHPAALVCTRVPVAACGCFFGPCISRPSLLVHLFVSPLLIRASGWLHLYYYSPNWSCTGSTACLLFLFFVLRCPRRLRRRTSQPLRFRYGFPSLHWPLQDLPARPGEEDQGSCHPAHVCPLCLPPTVITRAADTPVVQCSLKTFAPPFVCCPPLLPLIRYSG